MDELIPGSAERLVHELAEATRSLEDLSPAELDQAGAFYRLEEARRTLELRVNIARFELAQERKKFLDTVEKSKATQRTCRGALERALPRLVPAASGFIRHQRRWLTEKYLRALGKPL